MSATASERPGTVESGGGWSTVQVSCRGGSALVQVTSPLIDRAYQQLAEVLDWLIDTGSRQVHVEFGDGTAVDADCLGVLRHARARMRARMGRLDVDVTRPEARMTLALTGLAGDGANAGAGRSSG